MNYNLLLEVIVFILFVVCVGLFFLYKCVEAEVMDLKHELRLLSDELTNQKRTVWKHEQKLSKIKANKEKIEIVHKYDDSGAPRYPHDGGF